VKVKKTHDALLSIASSTHAIAIEGISQADLSAPINPAFLQQRIVSFRSNSRCHQNIYKLSLSCRFYAAIRENTLHRHAISLLSITYTEEAVAKFALAMKKPKSFAPMKRLFLQMAPGFLCYRMDEGTKFFAVAHPLLRRFP
jgi:hypothetical protein